MECKTDEDKKLYFNLINIDKIESDPHNRKNISIKWSSNCSFNKAVICIMSSYLTYDDFCNIINQNVHFNQPSKIIVQPIELSSKEFKLNDCSIDCPFDVIILPIKNNKPIIPSFDDFNMRKTQKKFIFYKINESGIFKNKIQLRFSTTGKPIPSEYIVLSYVIDNCFYPVTSKMFDKNIYLTIPKREKVTLKINQQYERYYDLKEYK